MANIADQIRVGSGPGAPDASQSDGAFGRGPHSPGPFSVGGPFVPSSAPSPCAPATRRLTDEERAERLRCFELASDVARINGGATLDKIIIEAEKLLKFVKGE